MGGSKHFDKRSGRWFVSVYWGGKQHRIFRYNGEPMFDPRTADKLLNKIRAEIDANTFQVKAYFPDSPLSIAEYTKRWLHIINVKSNTHKDYRLSVNRYIVPYFKDKDIRHIRHNDLTEFYRWIPRGEKGKYNVMSCLRTMLRYAWRNEDIPKVPPFPRLTMGERPEIQYYTLEQQERVLAAIPARHRPIFAFGMEYGLRIGELRAIQWNDITGGEVIIRRAFAENKLEDSTKTGEVRHYQVTPYILQMLRAMPVLSSTFVFVREDGKPYTIKNLNAIWKAAVERAGLEHIPLRCAIRHSLGCQLLDAGVEIGVVKDVLGHKKIEMTERYAKRSKAQVTAALVNRRAKVTEFLLNGSQGKKHNENKGLLVEAAGVEPDA